MYFNMFALQRYKRDHVDIVDAVGMKTTVSVVDEEKQQSRVVLSFLEQSLLTHLHV